MRRKKRDETRAPKTEGQSPSVFPEDAIRRRGKLLIVDDDLSVREIIGLFMSEKGYDCTLAESSDRAIYYLERERFDLVITDLHMPIMDGAALLEWVKLRLPTTKVMIITGDQDVALKSQVLKDGADNYLEKPFSIGHFLGEVERCLFNLRDGTESGNQSYPSNAYRF